MLTKSVDRENLELFFRVAPKRICGLLGCCNLRMLNMLKLCCEVQKAETAFESSHDKWISFGRCIEWIFVFLPK